MKEERRSPAAGPRRRRHRRRSLDGNKRPRTGIAQTGLNFGMSTVKRSKYVFALETNMSKDSGNIRLWEARKILQWQEPWNVRYEDYVSSSFSSTLNVRFPAICPKSFASKSVMRSRSRTNHCRICVAIHVLNQSERKNLLVWITWSLYMKVNRLSWHSVKKYG